MLMAVATVLGYPAVAPGQEPPSRTAELTGFWLTTPHPELAIRPGETETIPLTLRNSNQPPQRASIEVSGIPQDWKWSLKGGNREGATGNRIPISVRARYGNEVADLPLFVSLAGEQEGGLELKSELPALRGTANSTFSFKVDVKNDGDESLFNLVANVPDGFQTRFKRGYGSEEITGLPIEAGGTETVTLEVTPPRSAPAGRYPVVMEVSGGGASAAAELSIDVTGQADIGLTGPQERLSGDVVAGKEASFPFTLANTGSASPRQATVL
jgi:uncharacterized membrane protein